MKDKATRELLRGILKEMSVVAYVARLNDVHGIRVTPGHVRTWARGGGRIGSAVRAAIEFDAESLTDA